MSSKVIEIKAMTQEEAITRALKITEATPDHIVKVSTKQKSRSFLGIFNKQGIFIVEINKEKKKEPKKEIKKEIKVEKTENKKSEIKKDKEIKKDEKPKKQPKIKKEKVDKVVKEDKKNNEIIIKEKTEELLKYMNIAMEVKVRKTGKSYLVDLKGADNGVIIGKKGKTLNSFEYLLNSILKDYRIDVDVEKFREKRVETLKQVGRKMAQKALKTGKIVKLNPMPARERKIVHEVINEFPELETTSEGREPKRYIVIKKKR